MNLQSIPWPYLFAFILIGTMIVHNLVNAQYANHNQAPQYSHQYPNHNPYGQPQQNPNSYHQPPYNSGKSQYPGGRFNNPPPPPLTAPGPPSTYHNTNYNSIQQSKISPIMKQPIAPPPMNSNQHKCRIWIPMEAYSKYSWASKIQVDESKSLQLIEVCCPGYGHIRWGGITQCRPICKNCSNGRCVAPDQCQCYDEFVRTDNGDCVFSCPLGCLNGHCYLDGSCECNPGYKLDETRKFCRPICSAGCGMNPWHNCTEPEVCGCAKGYQLNDGGCRPVCNPPCGIGGTCRAPDTCECHAGYHNKDGVCQSDCYQKCDNGICFSRNRCICNPGFKYHERSTMCTPI